MHVNSSRAFHSSSQAGDAKCCKSNYAKYRAVVIVQSYTGVFLLVIVCLAWCVAVALQGVCLGCPGWALQLSPVMTGSHANQSAQQKEESAVCSVRLT